jgi:hypothetical protein
MTSKSALESVLECRNFHTAISPKLITGSINKVVIYAILRVLVGTPLNKLNQEFSVSRHANELQRLLTKEVRQCDRRFTVHVSATDLDNMVITLTMPDEGMTPDQVKAVVRKAFSRGFEPVSVHVEGA